MLLKILSILILLLGTISLHAATWYATSSSANINASSLWVPTSTGSCTGSGTPLSFGSQANGDIFNANGCTALAVNVDPGAATGASAGVCGTVTVTVTLETDPTNGGGFAYATATNIVIHANVTAGKTTALAITGSTGGGTICGNVTGSSGTASVEGVADTHTVNTIYEVGNITGGGALSTNGWQSNSSGPVNIAGNATAGTAAAADGFLQESSGAATITGNCTGSNSNTGIGCQTLSGSTGIITLTGNIINGTKGSGESGALYFTPAATNYVLYAKDSSYTLGTINSHSTLMPTDPGVNNVRSGTVYGPNTGTLSVTSTATNSGYAQ
jgi:hypothetical protein